jgi:integrating conjugative element protein (TIGR03752 family)
MSMVTSNRLLPLLAGTALVLTVVVAVKTCSPTAEQTHTLSSVPQAPPPDADTPADTIKTLTANVSAMTSELNALRRDNVELQQANRALVADRDKIEASVLTRVQQSLVSQRDPDAASETQTSLAALTAKVDALSQRVSAPRAAASVSTVADIPVGFGLGPEGGSEAPLWQWLPPLESATATSSQTRGPANRLRASAQASLATVRPEVERLVAKGADAVPASLPVFTVPRNATLLGSTGMTALVGRVPIQGQVRDPMPFKVITGKDNLAANGLHIPGVAGMIWSGTAIGDWTLACVSGTLTSVTFVFDDGTIHTQASDDSRAGGSSGTSERPLGWISDARGVPCVSGERKTNAPAFLSQRLGVMALQAAGDAAAQGETSTLVHDSGGATQLLTGRTGQYVLGKSISGGSDEVAQWLRERQAQSFDAVFVPAGVELAIHVDRELPIDFHTHGRKLHHDTSLLTPLPPQSVSGLD